MKKKQSNLSVISVVVILFCSACNGNGGTHSRNDLSHVNDSAKGSTHIDSTYSEPLSGGNFADTVQGMDSSFASEAPPAQTIVRKNEKEGFTPPPYPYPKEKIKNQKQIQDSFNKR
jgi:hypothetical protein